jgi:hypothetical protein
MGKTISVSRGAAGLASVGIMAIATSVAMTVPAHAAPIPARSNCYVLLSSEEGVDDPGSCCAGGPYGPIVRPLTTAVGATPGAVPAEHRPQVLDPIAGHHPHCMWPLSASS